jgi:hypothetical protein
MKTYQIIIDGANLSVKDRLEINDFVRVASGERDSVYTISNTKEGHWVETFDTLEERAKSIKTTLDMMYPNAILEMRVVG